jgi:hypothetical protein
MLWKEMQEYTRRRQAYLMSEKHAKTPQSTTILVTAIPDGLNAEDALFDIFNRFPGGVRAIWLNRYVHAVKSCLALVSTHHWLASSLSILTAHPLGTLKN